MRFRATLFTLIALLFLLTSSCTTGSGGSNLSAPVIPDAKPTNSAATLQPGHNLLGYYIITLDSITGTSEVVPVRAVDMHLNVLQFLEFGPCFDCLSIANFVKLPNKDFQFDVVLLHPFPTPNLSGFDVRGIAMFGGDFSFPTFGLTASSIFEGNPELLNPDGHTTLYNPGTAGNGLQGYLKGKLAPNFAAPNATINGFKTYFSNANRRYFLAGDELSANFIITHPDSVFTFGYAVDASWAKPTDPVTVPDSFPTTANSIEAYKIEATLNNPLALTAGSTATMTIDIYDWQGPTTIQSVSLEGPLLWDGVIDAVESAGGPGDKRFIADISNEFGFVDQGFYPVLVRVLDTSSSPGALIDNTAWRIVKVQVILNHAPTCMAEVSNIEPDPDEEVTFTDTSTDPEGLTDIVESWWDWENDGTYDEEGSVVNHSWPAAGIYQVNHKVIDAANAWDELDATLNLDVGLYITLQEDFDSKPMDRVYTYQSMDSSYSSGAVVNVDDLDGPWDFTTIGLAVGPNKVTIINDADAEVAGFVNDFNQATTHFSKFENMLDPFFPALYQAEYHHFPSQKLYIYGFHDPYIIGSSPFGPPDTVDSLAIPYPLTISTDYQFNINVTGFVLNYTVKAIGEGDVTVPYGGGTTYHCLLLIYRFNVSSAEPVNGGTLTFAFITDGGLTVANVIAVNDPPIYNWNSSSNKINSSGMALFQALDTIEN